VVTHRWIDFTRDYPEGMIGKSFLTVMFPMQFFIYNIVPYLTLAFMHYQNCKPNPR